MSHSHAQAVASTSGVGRWSDEPVEEGWRNNAWAHDGKPSGTSKQSQVPSGRNNNKNKSKSQENNNNKNKNNNIAAKGKIWQRVTDRPAVREQQPKRQAVDRKGRKGNPKHDAVHDDFKGMMQKFQGEIDAEREAKIVAKEEALDAIRMEERARIEEVQRSAYEGALDVQQRFAVGSQFLEDISDEKLTFRRKLSIFVIWIFLIGFAVFSVGYFFYAWWFGGLYSFAIKILWEITWYLGFTLPCFLFWWVVKETALWLNTNSVPYVWPAFRYSRMQPKSWHFHVVYFYLFVVHLHDKLWLYLPTVMVLWVLYFGMSLQAKWMRVEVPYFRRKVRIDAELLESDNDDDDDLSDDLAAQRRILGNYEDEDMARLPAYALVPYFITIIRPKLEWQAFGNWDYNLDSFPIARRVRDWKSLLGYVRGCVLDVLWFVEKRYYWVHTITDISTIVQGPIHPDLRTQEFQHLDLISGEMRVTMSINTQKMVHYGITYGGWQVDQPVDYFHGGVMSRQIMPCLATYAQLATSDMGGIDPSFDNFNDRVATKLRSSKVVNVNRHTALFTRVYEDTYYLQRMVWADNRCVRHSNPFH